LALRKLFGHVSRDDGAGRLRDLGTVGISLADVHGLHLALGEVLGNHALAVKGFADWKSNSVLPVEQLYHFAVPL